MTLYPIFHSNWKIVDFETNFFLNVLFVFDYFPPSLTLASRVKCISFVVTRINGVQETWHKATVNAHTHTPTFAESALELTLESANSSINAADSNADTPVVMSSSADCQ